MKLELTIETMETVVYGKTVDEVILPGLHGKVGARPGHAATLISLTAGEIIAKLDGKTESIPVTSGIAAITADKVDVSLKG